MQGPRLVEKGTISLSEYEKRTRQLSDSCLTIKEICRMWGYSANAVKAAIITGRFIAVKKDAAHGDRGGIWIVEQNSVIAQWGEPKNG